MGKFKFLDVSELAWHQSKNIENIKNNKNLKKYIIDSHIIILICTIIFGIVLGCYSKGEQIIFNALKIPILFLGTLYITLPIFFIIDVLLGNKITFFQMSSILFIGFTSSAVVLGAFTPLMLFFILTTLDYSFILILNISICGFAGYFGIVSIISCFEQFHKKTNWTPSMLIGGFFMMFVGTQLAWSLRPFFHSYSEFTKPVSSNFYVALAKLIEHNPTVALILIALFGFIAIFISITRMFENSPLKKSKYKKKNPKRKFRLVKEMSILH